MFCINPHHRKVGAKHNKDSVRTLQNVYGYILELKLNDSSYASLDILSVREPFDTGGELLLLLSGIT